MFALKCIYSKVCAHLKTKYQFYKVMSLFLKYKMKYESKKESTQSTKRSTGQTRTMSNIFRYLLTFSEKARCQCGHVLLSHFTALPLPHLIMAPIVHIYHAIYDAIMGNLAICLSIQKAEGRGEKGPSTCPQVLSVYSP